MEEVLRAGALSFVIKNIVAANLVGAIATVARGEAWLHREAPRSLVDRMRRPDDLTACAADRARALDTPPVASGKATVRSAACCISPKAR